MGETGIKDFNCTGKWLIEKKRYAVVMGGWDTGNQVPSEISERVANGVLHPEDAIIQATAGAHDQGERRCDVATPFNNVVDATLRSCAIVNRYAHVDDVLGSDTELFTTLVIAFSFNRIARHFQMSPRNIPLHVAECAFLVNAQTSVL